LGGVSEKNRNWGDAEDNLTESLMMLRKVLLKRMQN
jgi:hypothetical protein